MGRYRPLAGIPYTPEREIIEAQDFFDQISEFDQLVADKLDSEHIMAQHRHKSRIKSRLEFRVGDLVWVMKQKPIGGLKHRYIGMDPPPPYLDRAKTALPSYRKKVSPGQSILPSSNLISMMSWREGYHCTIIDRIPRIQHRKPTGGRNVVPQNRPGGSSVVSSPLVRSRLSS